ncbi:MAG TPA: carbamoyltransferase HypF [Acidimicrobiales bacterium]
MTALTTPDVVRLRVRVAGLVQGVGFRPHVHRLATAAGLTGFVGNDGAGVFAEVEGPRVAVDGVLERLVADAPPLARPERVDAVEVPCRGGAGFAIVDSPHGAAVATHVAPDAAVCDDCLAELFDPTDRRHRYPFITCADCGPRFTITTALPYDRPTTTMARFALCAACTAEYRDPTGRRFHAQPLACAACGPDLWLEGPRGTVTGSDAAIAEAQRLLVAGAVVAVKGLGGYHLACDARSDAAVGLLRRRKGRPDKPFAVMVPHLEAGAALAEIDAAEVALLASPARPIVLVRSRRGAAVAAAVAPGNPRLGVMLPYTPLHHLLFAPVPGDGAPVPGPLVMTSGNLTDEPICFEDGDARERLGGVADAFLVHDRPIHVPCDDSVMRVVGSRPLPLRRSRGYAPLPVRLPVEAPPALGVGGELKNTVCVARGRDAWLGPHIGDMGSVASLAAFERSTAQLRSLYEVEPAVVAADLHPGYHTVAWAERSGPRPVERVQHHHAHLAALLSEHGEPPDATVIGVVFDGTGYGADGTIWGGEILVGGYAAVERFGHLRPVPLPGGDTTVRRPYRSALAHLWSAGIGWQADLPPVAAGEPGELRVLARQLERDVGCVATSSAGRLVDAVASLLDVRHRVTYEAQAAMALEELAVAGAPDPAPCRCAVRGGEIDPRPLLAAVVNGVRAGVPAAAMAAGFHAALVDAVAEVAVAARDSTGATTVGLTGGAFQNALLATGARERLEDRGFRVLTHSLVPPNDGGLALGQVAVAAARAAAGPPTADQED